LASGGLGSQVAEPIQHGSSVRAAAPAGRAGYTPAPWTALAAQGKKRLGAPAYLVKPIVGLELQDVLATIAPRAAAQAESTMLLEAPDALQALPAPVILLAEDEEHNIYILSTYLEAKGYQLIVARNGAEALERAHAVSPTLIVMDIQMPGMDGLEAIQRIRANRTSGMIPIIALTALAMPGDRERCLAAGADEYLSKPVSMKGLVATIEAHLHRATASASPIHALIWNKLAVL